MLIKEGTFIRDRIVVGSPTLKGSLNKASIGQIDSTVCIECS